MEKVITSKQFSLKARDFIKGALLAVLAPVLVIVQESLDKGEFSFNWRLIGMTAVGAFVAYLLKNFFDKPKTIIVSATNQGAENKKTQLLTSWQVAKVEPHVALRFSESKTITPYENTDTDEAFMYLDEAQRVLNSNEYELYELTQSVNAGTLPIRPNKPRKPMFPR